MFLACALDSTDRARKDMYPGVEGERGDDAPASTEFDGMSLQEIRRYIQSQQLDGTGSAASILAALQALTCPALLHALKRQVEEQARRPWWKALEDTNPDLYEALLCPVTHAPELEWWLTDCGDRISSAALLGMLKAGRGAQHPLSRNPIRHVTCLREVSVKVQVWAQQHAPYLMDDMSDVFVPPCPPGSVTLAVHLISSCLRSPNTRRLFRANARMEQESLLCFLTALGGRHSDLGRHHSGGHEATEHREDVEAHGNGSMAQRASSSVPEREEHRAGNDSVPVESGTLAFLYDLSRLIGQA